MLGLYVHVPFCVRKCDYCAFFSYPLVGNEKIEEYTKMDEDGKALVSVFLDGLGVEIQRYQKDAPLGVSSLFIGGGTPTALDIEELERLLEVLKRGFLLAAGAEATVEGNPGTLTEDKLELLRRYGINRFSLGVQSFSDRSLKEIGRIHTSEQVRQSIRLLREAGFNNLNLDLMFGLPGQGLEDWQETLEQALTFNPEHLSLYGLMIEEGTPLARRLESIQGIEGDLNVERVDLGLIMPDDDLQAQMYAWAITRLIGLGYVHYETSNFALPGFECQHNFRYWTGKDYLGLGPGAVSCLRGSRWKNIEDIWDYRRRLALGQNPSDESERESLSLRVRMAERVILGLRLAKGVDMLAFQQDFGRDIRDIYAEVLIKYEKTGILFVQEGHLCLNQEYVFLANSVLQDFV
ncbi:MAG: radical SAM family heme chaperone HemW [Desulfitobacteriaceae bacterium]